MKNKSIQQQLEWLEKEKQKDEIILNREKLQMINEIKKIKKDEIFPIKPKLTLWQRIKKVLMN